MSGCQESTAPSPHHEHPEDPFLGSGTRLQLIALIELKLPELCPSDLSVTPGYFLLAVKSSMGGGGDVCACACVSVKAGPPFGMESIEPKNSWER